MLVVVSSTTACQLRCQECRQSYFALGKLLLVEGRCFLASQHITHIHPYDDYKSIKVNFFLSHDDDDDTDTTILG